MIIEIQNPLHNQMDRNREEKDQNIKKVYYKRRKMKIFTFFSITFH